MKVISLNINRGDRMCPNDVHILAGNTAIGTSINHVTSNVDVVVTCNAVLDGGVVKNEAYGLVIFFNDSPRGNLVVDEEFSDDTILVLSIKFLAVGLRHCLAWVTSGEFSLIDRSVEGDGTGAGRRFVIIEIIRALHQSAPAFDFQFHF